jgi:hypothetical protein
LHIYAIQDIQDILDTFTDTIIERAIQQELECEDSNPSTLFPTPRGLSAEVSTESMDRCSESLYAMKISRSISGATTINGVLSAEVRVLLGFGY